MTIAADESRESSARLKRELKLVDAKKRAMALALIAPLAIFLFLIFVVPIGALLTRAVQNPEVAGALPHTGAALSGSGVHATGICPSPASRPDVGSKPIQPAPGKYASAQACRSRESVFPASDAN